MYEPPVLIKIGGSLLKHADKTNLRQLASIISQAGQDRTIYIVTGGGPFADLVREQHEQWHLGEEASHFMAAAAMDQFAWLLHDLLNGSSISNLEPKKVTVDKPGCHIMLFSHYLQHLPASVLPRSWQVTADSLAAHAAGLLNCRALLLLKSASFESGDAAKALDSYFPHLLPLPFPILILNGRETRHLAAWLKNGQAPGLSIPQGTARLSGSF